MRPLRWVAVVAVLVAVLGGAWAADSAREDLALRGHAVGVPAPDRKLEVVGKPHPLLRAETTDLLRNYVLITVRGGFRLARVTCPSPNPQDDVVGGDGICDFQTPGAIVRISVPVELPVDPRVVAPRPNPDLNPYPDPDTAPNTVTVVEVVASFFKPPVVEVRWVAGDGGDQFLEPSVGGSDPTATGLFECSARVGAEDDETARLKKCSAVYKAGASTRSLTKHTLEATGASGGLKDSGLSGLEPIGPADLDDAVPEVAGGRGLPWHQLGLTAFKAKAIHPVTGKLVSIPRRPESAPGGPRGTRLAGPAGAELDGISEDGLDVSTHSVDYAQGGPRIRQPTADIVRKLVEEGRTSTWPDIKNQLYWLQQNSKCSDDDEEAMDKEDRSQREYQAHVSKCPFWVEPGACTPSEAVTYSFEKEYMSTDSEAMTPVFELFGPLHPQCAALFYGVMTPELRFRFFRDTYLTGKSLDMEWFDRAQKLEKKAAKEHTQLPESSSVWAHLMTENGGPGLPLLHFDVGMMGFGEKGSCRVHRRMPFEQETGKHMTMYQRKNPGTWWLSRCLEQDNDNTAEVKSSSFEYDLTSILDHMSSILTNKPTGWSATQMHVAFNQPTDPTVRSHLWAIGVYIGDYLFASTFGNSVYDKFNAPVGRVLQHDLTSPDTDAPVLSEETLPIRVGGSTYSIEELKYHPLGFRLPSVYGDPTGRRVGFELRKGAESLAVVSRALSNYIQGTTRDPATSQPVLCLNGPASCVTGQQVLEFVRSSRMVSDNDQQDVMGGVFNALVAVMRPRMVARGFEKTPEAPSLKSAIELLLYTDWASLPGVVAAKDEALSAAIDTAVSLAQSDLNLIQAAYDATLDPRTRRPKPALQSKYFPKAQRAEYVDRLLTRCQLIATLVHKFF